MDHDDSTETTSVLGFAGSLREGSCNRTLLRAAVGLAPPSMTIEPFDPGGIPLYDADRDTDEKFEDGELVHEPTRRVGC